MARHYLYEAANVLLTTVKRRFALRNWGLKLVRDDWAEARPVAVKRKPLCLWGACGRTARTSRRLSRHSRGKAWR